MMNRTGQTLMLSILFAAMFFIFGITFLNYIQPEVKNTQTALDCNNVNAISDGTKLMCLAVDGVVPYFVVLVISSAGGVVMARLAL